HEQPLQGFLGRRLPADIAGRDALGAILGDVLEQAALMRGVALHGLDQIRHEIGPPPQLHIDAAPAFAHYVAHANQVIEDLDDEDHDSNRDTDDDPFHAHLPFGHGLNHSAQRVWLSHAEITIGSNRKPRLYSVGLSNV